MTYIAKYGPLGPELCQARIQSRTEHFVVFERGSFEEVFNTGWLREGRRLSSDGLCITESLPEAMTWLYTQIAESRAGVEAVYQRELTYLAKQLATLDTAVAALGVDVSTPLALADAIALLPPGSDALEVARPSKHDTAVILTSLRERTRIYECLEKNGGQIASPQWQALGFGLVIQDSVGKLYVRTAERGRT